MSVLVDLSIFPVAAGEHLSQYVAPVVGMIAASGHPYQLTAMGTLIETAVLAEALELIERAHSLLAAAGCERVYATVKLDIRSGPPGRLQGKPASVAARLEAADQTPAEAGPRP
ncbi:MAG: thiamine-binding protein [Chromatiaceae bacterium]|nr:MAG: thiamine-binding protein [Chromatiaceae bacterium]